MKRSAALILCALLISCTGFLPALAADDLASRIVEMTGARTRIVWQHQATEAPGSGWDATTPTALGYGHSIGATNVTPPGGDQPVAYWLTDLSRARTW